MTAMQNVEIRDEITALDPEQFRSIPTMLLPHSRVSFVLTVFLEPGSIASEQYRLIAHYIERKAADRKNYVIAVSSALEGEGKTSTSLNLAFALAEAKNKKTCLVDLDMRGGKVAQALGLGDVEGVSDVLRGKKPVREVIKRIDKNLAVVPSGPPTQHTLALLRTPGWQKLLDSLRSNFDYILLDCPPLCMSDDMALIDDVTDRILLVVRSGATTGEAVKDAIAKIVPAKALGFVLNDANLIQKKYRPYKRDF